MSTLLCSDRNTRGSARKVRVCKDKLMDSRKHRRFEILCIARATRRFSFEVLRAQSGNKTHSHSIRSIGFEQSRARYLFFSAKSNEYQLTAALHGCNVFGFQSLRKILKYGVKVKMLSLLYALDHKKGSIAQLVSNGMRVMGIKKE